MGRSTLVPALAAFALATAACSGEGERSPARAAVLITLDTTRADALGCYGGRAGVTPHLDALAREGVLYEAARSVAPLTLPAHASMLTGLVPPRHGLRDNGLRALPASATTIAEAMRERGGSTAAFVAAIVLDRAWGLAQGFEVYDQPEGAAEARLAMAERGAEEVVDAAVAWLDERGRDERFFLWVHLFDPHAPYEPPPERLTQAGGDPYLGEVARVDAAVGEIVGALRERGRLDDALVVVVADHGEALGQHGEPTHSIFCYEPTIRVPMIVRHGDLWAAGTRVREAVGVVDVAPTIAEALGLDLPAGLDGTSLFRRAPPPGRSTYFESYCGWLNYGWSQIAGCADGELKWIESGTSELYRLAGDPREKANLADSEPEAVARGRASIERLSSGRALPRDDADAVAEGMQERIRSLGYAGAGDPDADLPAPLEPSGRPSPRERLPELRAYYAALEKANAGQRGEAIAGLEAIVAANPRNLAALDVLGALLVDERRCDQAVAVLEKLLASGPERTTTLASLAACLELRGEIERAIAVRRRALELKPGGASEVEALARALEKAGRTDEAGEVRRASPER